MFYPLKGRLSSLYLQCFVTDRHIDIYLVCLCNSCMNVSQKKYSLLRIEDIKNEAVVRGFVSSQVVRVRIPEMEYVLIEFVTAAACVACVDRGRGRKKNKEK